MIRPSQQERSHIELIAVYEICRVLGASLDLQRSFRAALNILDAQIGLPRVMIVLPDEDDSRLRVHSYVGLDREQAGRGVWQVGEGMIGRVYQHGVSVTVPDVTQAEEFIDRTGAFSAQDGQMMSFMVVPIKTDHEVLGVLAAQRAVEGNARLSDDHRILKGGSWATRAPVLRTSFRNFFRRHFRIAFAGIRCATDA